MDETMDMNRELMLDGNAVGGMMYEVFGIEMTSTPAECANCGAEHPMGALLAFTQAPGVILRCPICENVMVRLVAAPDAIYVDARGVAALRMERRPVV